MQVRTKKPVWFLFKLMELLLSLGCCIIHWRCFMEEGVPHIFILCGTYGGSVIICLLSLIGAFYAERPTMKHEAAFGGMLGVLHIFTVYAHMYMATLEEFQTDKWPNFYMCCRDNALIALYAGAIYLLHCTFALDLMISHKQRKMRTQRSKRPLRLYFISPGAEAYLSRFWWYQRIAANLLTSAHASEHSSRKNYSFSDSSESDSEATEMGIKDKESFLK
ncbi:uncharacterized protein LOC108087713 [Drosophila ficusphila]|uniref:uncharacterized protein LOC108087713 n=1 Tax=Drosophila ficusphila TaxID=30025 RepID=UPI0007E78F08|nr:uncharacterized protein LOC108087713 [Drosophila ficusphila]